jgi:hypothetical protein
MLTLALALFSSSADAQEIRALHLSPDAPAVDIFLDNGTPAAVPNLAFTEGTPFVPVSAGITNVKVSASPGSTNAAVIDADVDIPSGARASVFAFDALANIGAGVIYEDLTGLASGDVRLTVTHAAVGVGNVNVLVRGLGEVSSDFPFAETFTADLPAGPIQVGLDTDLDGLTDWSFDVPDLGSDAMVNVFAATDASGQPFLLAWLPDGSTARVDGAFRAPATVRFAHLSPDAPNVDVYVDGALAIEDIGFQEVASGLAVPAGRRLVEVFVTGTQTGAVFTNDRVFASGASYTIGAFGNLANLRASRMGTPSCDAGLLCANVAHAADGVGTVDIYEAIGGSVLLAGVPYGGAGSLAVPAGAYTIGLDVDFDGTSDFTFDVPDVGAQTVDVFAVLDSVGPFLQVVLEDGTPVRIDAN